MEKYFVNHVGMSTEEMIDIVDDNDIVVDVKPRSYIREHKIKNSRIVLAVIRNERGEFFVVKRAVKPNTGYPGTISFIGGAVSSGETYEQAFIREVFEETTLELKPENYKLLGILHPQKDLAPNFAAVYEICSSREVPPNCDVFSECYWLTIEEIRQRLAAGVASAPSLPIILQRFYSHE
jgi:mutator protein MutT